MNMIGLSPTEVKAPRDLWSAGRRKCFPAPTLCGMHKPLGCIPNTYHQENEGKLIFTTSNNLEESISIIE